jgi:hypothetical protein
MPLVETGDAHTPFIIGRFGDGGGWSVAYPYPPDDGGKSFRACREKDPLVSEFKGADFGRKDPETICNTALLQRMRDEYLVSELPEKEKAAFAALFYFFEDRIGEFTEAVTEYLQEADRPLAELKKMCPYNMTSNFGELYSSVYADETIDNIERAAYRHKFSAYKDRQNIRVGDITVTLAENKKAASPAYIVYSRNKSGEIYNVAASLGYDAALEEVKSRLKRLSEYLPKEKKHDSWER